MKRPGLVSLSLSAFWALAGLPLPAAHAAELAWSAPAECGDSAAIYAQVEHLLDRPLGDVTDVTFDLAITARDPHHFQSSLRTRTAGVERTRELEAASCAELKDAAALAIALTVRTLSAEPPTEPAIADPQASPEAALEVRASPPPTAAAPESRRSVRFALAGGLALDFGVLPALAPGAALEGSLAWGALRVLAQGVYFASQAARLSDGREGGEIGLWVGAVLACAARRLGSASLELAACGGFELGRFSSDAVGASVRYNPSRTVYGPRAELGLAWQALEELGFFVRMGAALPLVRDTFVLNQDDAERVHRPSQLSLRATLGVYFAL